MHFASIVYRHFTGNQLFEDGFGDYSGTFYLPFAQIRNRFLKNGIELNTPDVNRGRKVSFELHINVQRHPPARPAYVYQYENALVRPRNEDMRALQAYRKIFTWNTVLAQQLGRDHFRHPHAVILPYPNRLEFSTFAPWRTRSRGCVLVASNKSLAVHDHRDLYLKRIEMIRAFESTAPAGFFELYGRGWEYPAAQPGRVGKFLASLSRRLNPSPKRPFPSWRGPIADKDGLLRDSRFAICYENGADIPGYITEKIFDCLRAGCVPIYWGPREIASQIPPDCYIDARAFPNANAIVAKVTSLGEKEHAHYQAAMARFLHSPQAARFSEDHFVHTLYDEIAADRAAWHGGWNAERLADHSDRISGSTTR